MLDQLLQIVQQYGDAAVVKNTAIPDEQKEAVLQETNLALLTNLQKIANQGDLSQIAELLQTNNFTTTNPTVQSITQSVAGSLTEKLGLNPSTANGAATHMIPQILRTIISKAKDPNDHSFNISDLLGDLTGGNTARNAGIMEAMSTYGVHFGLDQNNDGKLDLDDAVALTKKGGITGIFGKLFGK